MKNLLRKFTIEILDNLPKKMTGHKLHRIYNDWYRWGNTDTHPINNIHPHDRVDRILEKFIGKHVNEAFSYYCKQVPKYQQFVFWENITNDPFRRRYYSIVYTVDENDCIIKINNRKKRIFSITSKDYEIELRHKVTGHKKKEFTEVFERIEKTRTVNLTNPIRSYTYNWKENGKFLYYEYGTKGPWAFRYRAKESDFISVVVQGYVKTFESANDPKFVRHNAEKAKQRRKEHKQRKKLRKEESLEKLRLMYEKEKERREKEKQENLLKIIKHGFDPITSFRTEKQTNPYLIINKQKIMKKINPST